MTDSASTLDAPIFTIFTAAFNRPNLLKRAWQSLEAQTLRDLEWVIVDDGSGPDVRRAVEEIQRDASFPVRYFWHTNQGKHVAHNRAAQEARGTYFATLDDDDTLLPQALERSLFHWDQIPAERRTEYASVVGLCVDETGALHGLPFRVDVLEQEGTENASKRIWRDGSHPEMIFRWRGYAERWGTYRVDVLLRFPYPAPEGAYAYMNEDIILFRMGLSYRTRYINEVLRVWNRSGETLTNYMSSQLPDLARIAPVQIAVRRHRFVELYDYFRDDPRFFLISATQYTRFSLHNGSSLLSQWRDIPGFWPRLLWLVTLPAGIAAWLRDMWRVRPARLSGKTSRRGYQAADHGTDQAADRGANKP